MNLSQSISSLFSKIKANATSALSRFNELSHEDEKESFSFYHRNMGAKLSVSLPSIAGDYFGLFIHMEIPMFCNISILINYEESKQVYIVEHRGFDRLQLATLVFPSSEELLNSTYSKILTIFIEAYQNKEKVIETLLHNYLQNDENISFKTLNNIMGAAYKNSYLYYYSEFTNAVFINNITGTNTAFSTNNMDRIQEGFNAIYAPKNRKFLSIFSIDKGILIVDQDGNTIHFFDKNNVRNTWRDILKNLELEYNSIIF